MHTNACGTSKSYRLPKKSHHKTPTRVELFELPSKNTSKHPYNEIVKIWVMLRRIFKLIFVLLFDLFLSKITPFETCMYLYK